MREGKGETKMMVGVEGGRRSNACKWERRRKRKGRILRTGKEREREAASSVVREEKSKLTVQCILHEGLNDWKDKTVAQS